MQITKRNVAIKVDDSLMRIYVAAPKPPGRYPGIVFYSDIYQLGAPITRLANHLAGYGYVVAAPEIFHRLEPIGTVFEPDDLGRIKGNDAAQRSEIHGFDLDAQALVNFLEADPQVLPENIGTIGFCIGGHLALRTAFLPAIKAAACCYPTGIHNGKLGRGVADTIDRLAEIQGEALIIFGTADPHIPTPDRELIVTKMQASGCKHHIICYENADHTFMRDDGHRFDPVFTDAAWSAITAWFQRTLGG